MTLPAALSEADLLQTIEAVQDIEAVPKILRIVCKLTGMRFAAIARVTDQRWTACSVLNELNFGLKPGDDLVLTTTICHEIRQHRQPVVFGNADDHPIYATHPTPQLYGLKSYVSVPIVTHRGEFFGTLCAIDSEPRDFDPETVVETLSLFASVVASQLHLETRVVEAEQALHEEVSTGVLREEFLAVVGHDLRSPLQSARLVAERLVPLQSSETGERLTGYLLRSIERMGDLIADIMDFARGRLGGGVPLDLQPRQDLSAVIEAAVDEITKAHPECTVLMEAPTTPLLHFDAKRLQQLLTNLLSNAVAHGDIERPILVRLAETHHGWSLSVTNQGVPIPLRALDRLFEPFYRPESHLPRPGLGLGLFIAREIARGHGGTLTVQSSADNGTTFALLLPHIGAT